jgi:hypothetical protein
LVRWYLQFKLSFLDLVEMMAERGISLAHATILRWIQRYVHEFEKRWKRLYLTPIPIMAAIVPLPGSDVTEPASQFTD